MGGGPSLWLLALQHAVSASGCWPGCSEVPDLTYIGLNFFKESNKPHPPNSSKEEKNAE